MRGALATPPDLGSGVTAFDSRASDVTRIARWSSRHGYRALNAETEVRTLDGQRSTRWSMTGCAAPVLQRQTGFGSWHFAHN